MDYPQCKGIKKDGKRCSRPGIDNGYCWQHKGQFLNPVVAKSSKTKEERIEVGGQSRLQYFLNMPHDLFVQLIDSGGLKGKEVMGLCLASTEMLAKCEHKNHEVFNRLLIKEFGIPDENRPGGNRNETPREEYFRRSKNMETCQKLMTRLERIRSLQIDVWSISKSGNIYDLLYASGNGNHDLEGDLLLGNHRYIQMVYMPTKSNPDDIHNLDKIIASKVLNRAKMDAYTPYQIFTDRDEVADHEQIVFDYDWAMEVYGSEEEYLETEAEYSEYPPSIDKLRNYPKYYVEALVENFPVYNNFEALRNYLRTSISRYFQNFIDTEDGIENVFSSDDPQYIEENGKVLTDDFSEEEIDFILDIHQRVLSGELRINDLADCKTLV